MTTQKQPKAYKRQPDALKPFPAQARSTSALPNFDSLPDSALVRQAHLVRDPKHPTRPTPLPFSPATFWRKVKEGHFPQPIKLGKRITAWKVSEVRAWMKAQTSESPASPTSPLGQRGGAQ